MRPPFAHGCPNRWGEPDLRVAGDTLTGTLSYAGQRVAMGTMVYKHDATCGDPETCSASLAKTSVNLKLIPCVTGKPRIAELVAFEMSEITVKGFWRGDARLHLVPHVNAPVADLSLPYGRIVHDYLA